MRILLAGDTHGQLQQWHYLFEVARESDCHDIVQLGDFGYWEHTQEGKQKLDALAMFCLKDNVSIYWIDGNHENHTMLRRTYDCTNGPVEIRPRVWYMPRGTRWTWGDTSFLAAGGAYSIDKNWRKPGKSWWPEEMITDEEVEKCIKPGKVDIVLSHDCPQGVDLPAHFARLGLPFFKNEVATEVNRRKLRKIVDETRPTALYHGHYHIRYSDTLSYNFGNSKCKVMGLACHDMGQDSWMILDV